MERKVMIGCPVRNRAWILPAYLQSLEALDYPRESISYCFIINDCDDSTPVILRDFAQKYPGQVVLVDNNAGTRAYQRGQYSFKRLADLRNLLLMEFMRSDCDYLFSVDSDILVTPHSLTALMQNDCSIVSCLVCNGEVIGDRSCYNVLYQSDRGHYLHIRNFPRDRLFRVDCTGAAYLIKRRVISQLGIRYSALAGAEDIGFCEAARQKGVHIYCDGRLECTHVMKPV
ncbi:MAG: glycosyltransferase [Syntrophomonadaceae bacterium]|jgi:cellulose synthase/poly-beta-1,6-N-acetylglucosamine synthase-like glycosyltransferase|nr:glycosyltransferase [Syntrophomonadaceae bacterium]